MPLRSWRRRVMATCGYPYRYCVAHPSRAAEPFKKIADQGVHEKKVLHLLKVCTTCQADPKTRSGRPCQKVCHTFYDKKIIWKSRDLVLCIIYSPGSCAPRCPQVSRARCSSACRRWYAFARCPAPASSPAQNRPSVQNKNKSIKKGNDEVLLCINILYHT